MDRGTLTVLAVAGAYLVMSLVVGMWPGKRASSTVDGYVTGDRSLGLLLMYFITGATIFSSFAFLGAPGWAYSRGAAGFYILAYGAVGFIPFYFLGPRASRIGRARGVVTQAQLVADRFQLPALAMVMALVSVAAFVPYLALQIKGAGIIVFAVTRGTVPEWLGGGIVYAVVLAYVLKSGVLGVGFTNTLQGIFMMSLAWGLGLVLPYELYGGIRPLFERLASERPELLLAPGLAANGGAWSWGEYSSAVLVSAIGFSMWPHLFMKAFTARDTKTIRRTVVLYPTFQLFLLPLFLIGFCGVFFQPPPSEPDQILPHMLMSLEIHPVVVGLFCAGGLAASMSSGDAMAHAAASIAVRDGLLVGLGRSMDPQRERALIRGMVVVIMMASYALAVAYGGSLVRLLLYAYGAVVQFAPATVATLCVARVSGRGVLAGLVAGSAVGLLFTIAPELRPWPVHAGLYGLVANLALVVVTSWRSASEDRDAADYLSIARGAGTDC